MLYIIQDTHFIDDYTDIIQGSFLVNAYLLSHAERDGT